MNAENKQINKQASERMCARVLGKRPVTKRWTTVFPKRTWSRRQMGKTRKWGLGGLALRPIQTVPSETEPGPAGDDVKTETHSPQSLLGKNHFFSGFRDEVITLVHNNHASFISSFQLLDVTVLSLLFFTWIYGVCGWSCGAKMYVNSRGLIVEQ